MKIERKNLPRGRAVFELVVGLGLIVTLAATMIIERQWSVQPADVLEQVQQLRAEVGELRTELRRD